MSENEEPQPPLEANAEPIPDPAPKSAATGGTRKFFHQLRQLPGTLAQRRRDHRFHIDDQPTDTGPGGTDQTGPDNFAALDVGTAANPVHVQSITDPKEATAIRSAAKMFAHPVQAGFFATVGVGLALVLYWIMSSNWSLLVAILAAVFIALGLDPIVRKVVSWGAPRWVGVLGAVVLLLAIFVALGWILIPTVVNQIAGFANQVPRIISDFLSSELFHDLDDRFDISTVALNQFSEFISNRDNWTNVAGGLFGFGTAVVNTGFSVLIVIVLALYFLASLPSIKYWLYRLAPASKRGRVEELSEKITSSVGNYVIGQTVVATANGIVAFIALSIVGAPFAALMATFAGLMAFIPLVGAVTGGIVLTVLLLLNSWQAALVFAIIYFIYLQVEAYLVSPNVMKRAVSVPGSIAVIAVIAGGSLLGVLGALIAIPTAASILTIVKEVIVPHQDRK